jgi:hypothetical protein
VHLVVPLHLIRKIQHRSSIVYQCIHAHVLFFCICTSLHRYNKRCHWSHGRLVQYHDVLACYTCYHALSVYNQSSLSYWQCDAFAAKFDPLLYARDVVLIVCSYTSIESDRSCISQCFYGHMQCMQFRRPDDLAHQSVEGTIQGLI